MLPWYSPSHHSPDFSRMLMTASLGKPIVSLVVAWKSYKATTWSMTLAGRVDAVAAAGAAVSVVGVVTTAAAVTTGVEDSAGAAITVGVWPALAAIPSFETDLSRFLSSLFRLDSELLPETLAPPIAEGAAAAVGVVVALFTRLPLLPDTDCPIMPNENERSG